MAGRQDIIRRITGHPLFAAWQLDALRSAALAGTLQCYESSPPAEQSLPVWQLISTPVENLRNRAERIAPQLAKTEGIAAATAVETRSPLAAALIVDGGWPSYAVALTAADGDVQSLVKRLGDAPQAVIGRVEHERLLLDLRTVFPRQDKLLIEALTGSPISPPCAENPSALDAGETGTS
jgi:L-seryl-tRNA(Ser) seleniumtransferase